MADANANATRNGFTFEEWKKLVDRKVSSKIGIGVDDLPDLTDQYSLWLNGSSPEEAANDILETALEDAGFDPDDLL